MNGALGVMLGSFIASWGMSALYFIVGMSSILLFMKAIGKRSMRMREMFLKLMKLYKSEPVILGFAFI